jgi:hypothetical protein
VVEVSKETEDQSALMQGGANSTETKEVKKVEEL